MKIKMNNCLIKLLQTIMMRKSNVYKFTYIYYNLTYLYVINLIYKRHYTIIKHSREYIFPGRK